MKRRLTTCLIVLACLGATSAFAQDSAPAPAPVDITIIPGGGTFFLKGKDTGEPAFGNYDIGGALAVNFNSLVGVEGEVSGSIGVSQRLDFGTVERSDRSPNLLQYSGNLVVYAPARGSLVPYVTAGVGGLSLFDKAALDIAETKTFLTGNVGGGVKWYAGRWGLRVDYRFLAVQAQDQDPPAPNVRPRPDFFGKETRYGHRVYGGIVLNIN
jgi:hypothetical protein